MSNLTTSSLFELFAQKYQLPRHTIDCLKKDAQESYLNFDICVDTIYFGVNPKIRIQNILNVLSQKFAYEPVVILRECDPKKPPLVLKTYEIRVSNKKRIHDPNASKIYFEVNLYGDPRDTYKLALRRRGIVTNDTMPLENDNSKYYC